jgi:hypothetical protein
MPSSFTAETMAFTCRSDGPALPYGRARAPFSIRYRFAT